jgi:thiol-disulfide isomerase/thioredoxin
MTKLLATMAISAVAALALAACAAPAATPPQASPSPAPITTPASTPDSSPTATAESPEPAPVPAQLEFTTTTVADGAAFEGASLAGKNTVLWFWAPWCPVCQAESGTVAAAFAELPDDVTLIGVSGRADVPAMQAFLADYGVSNFQHIADVDGTVWGNFGISYQPAFAFIGADGEITTVPSSMSKADILAAASNLGT